jgi:hypothetical protein
VKGVGFIAEADKSVADRMFGAPHFQPLEKTGLHKLLDYIVRNPVRSPRTSQITAGLDGRGIGKDESGSSWTEEPWFLRLKGDDGAVLEAGAAAGYLMGKSKGSAASALKQRLAGVQTIEEAAELIEKAIVSKLSDMFVVPEEDIDTGKPLSKYGLESLVAVELRNWLVPATQGDVYIFDLLGAKSMHDLSLDVAKIRSVA